MKKLLLLIFLLTLTACTTPVPDPPQFKLSDSVDILGVGDAWEAGTCEVTYNGQTYNMTIQNEPDTDTIGEYEILYKRTVNDQEFTCKRVVKVIDNIPPVVTLNPGVDTIKVGTEWVDAGVTATDNLSEVTITTVEEVNTDETGTYVVTYIVQDEEYNITTVKRIVKVIP